MCYLKLWENNIFFLIFFSFLKLIVGLTISTWKPQKKKMQVARNHDFDTHFQRLNRKMLFC
jgi:hypothetical protein